MKLVRYGKAGKEKPGLIDGDGALRSLADEIDDIDPGMLSAASLKRLSRLKPETLPKVRGKPRMGVPLTGIGKIVCIGLNYTDHAKEVGLAAPEMPIVFLKPLSSLNGPNDPIRIIDKKDSKHTDWEVELGVVIGRKAHHVSEADALKHVAGYCVLHDVSERRYQGYGTGQWVLGKAGDTFCPLGPWLVTADEVPDPQKLHLWCEVNGKMMQDGTTANMIFPVAHLISFVSRFMTLEPGDVMATGTPAGVGQGRKPRVFLKAGDTVRMGIEGMGEQSSKIVAPD
jgi:2-keto-4-pentenoate hydratase/2-oxohepta-3-ene-1,7-dioic acid hydratase in catechol pathway